MCNIDKITWNIAIESSKTNRTVQNIYLLKECQCQINLVLFQFQLFD